MMHVLTQTISLKSEETGHSPVAQRLPLSAVKRCISQSTLTGPMRPCQITGMLVIYGCTGTHAHKLMDLDNRQDSVLCRSAVAAQGLAAPVATTGHDYRSAKKASNAPDYIGYAQDGFQRGVICSTFCGLPCLGFEQVALCVLLDMQSYGSSARKEPSCASKSSNTYLWALLVALVGAVLVNSFGTASCLVKIRQVVFDHQIPHRKPNTSTLIGLPRHASVGRSVLEIIISQN